MKCQLGLEVRLLDKGFSPPSKYVELGLCFISRQPSKANWPEQGDFSSVLIGEAGEMSDSHLDCAHSLNNTTKTIKHVGEWT